MDTSLAVIGLNHRTASVEEDLERVVAHNFSELRAAATQAGQLVAHEAPKALTSQLVQRMATPLARELKQISKKPGHEQLTAAARGLFRLRARAAASENAAYNPSRTAFADGD